MNKVFLIGNLTKDPELSETQSGTSVCRFSIAVSRSYTNRDGERETDFFNCTAWRGLAENIAKFCQKGNKVAVTGSVQIRNYEDNNGTKRTAVDVIVQDVEFLVSKSNSDGNYGGSRENTQGRYSSACKPNLEAFDDDGDIPF